MHTTNQLLDAVAAKHGGATDYRLSKLLHTSTQTVSNWRRGRSSLNPTFAVRVAELLKWEPAYVIACVERERAEKDTRLEQTDEIVATWQKIADRFRPALAITLVATLGLFSGGGKASAAEVSDTSTAFCQADAVYIMRNWKRRRRDRMREIRRWLGTWLPAATLHPLAA